MWPRSVCASRRAGRHRGRASSASLPGSRGSISSSSRTRAAGASWPGAPGGGGGPAAIALPPILPARYRPADLERIREAAPGSRIVTVSLEGLADAPLDDVEVLLRGPLPAPGFDRLLGRRPGLP